MQTVFMIIYFGVLPLTLLALLWKILDIVDKIYDKLDENSIPKQIIEEKPGRQHLKYGARSWRQWGGFCL